MRVTISAAIRISTVRVSAAVVILVSFFLVAEIVIFRLYGRIFVFLKIFLQIERFFHLKRPLFLGKIVPGRE